MLALLAGALAAGPGAAQEHDESGAAAEAGRWSVAGGCAARTGVALEPPLLDEPVLAWRHAARGTIESEPLVWDGRVLLAVRDTPTRRSLHVLDLASGAVQLSQALPATLPLAPALWDARVAVRPAPERVEVFRIDGPRLRPFRTIRAAGPVSEPLLLDDQLFLREGDELVRYDLDRAEAVWRARAPGAYRGAPAVRGEHVYAVAYGREGRALLVALRRTDGGIASAVEVGHHGGAVPGPEAELELAVLAREVFVRHALPVPGAEGEQEYGWSRTPLDGPGRLRAGATTLHRLATAPVPVGVADVGLAPGAADAREAWVARVEAMEGRAWVCGTIGAGGSRSIVLADRTSHAALLDRPAPAAAGGLLHLGELAVDPADWSILWRAPEVPRLRPVPAGGALLVVSGEGGLACLRPPPAPVQPSLERVAEARQAARRRLAEGYAALAGEAQRAGDVTLLRRFVERAERLGAEGRGLASARAGLERLEAVARPVPTDPRRLQALELRAAELERGPAEELLSRARAAGDGELGRALLRAVLEEQPDHPGAAQLADAWIPAELPRTRPLPAASWLDFLDAGARTPLRYVPPRALAAGGGARGGGALDDAGWRAGAGGYASERLLVLAAPGRPGAVARALELGELLCGVLEELFAPLGRVSAGAEPLTLLLYESREVYLAESRRAGSLPEAALGWTAGHYSSADGLSRMFVPEDDRDARRLLGVYAHELTHHWIDARAPFHTGRTGRGGPGMDQPGFWLVEGFATLVEELALDPRTGAWSAPDPRAQSLDVLANAPPEALIPWERLLAASQREFAALDPTPAHTIPLAWRLGARRQQSEVQLFYVQAAAACHFLFEAEDGARRPALLATLAACYAGEREALDVQRAFGLTPAELGRRTVEHARAMLGAAVR